MKGTLGILLIVLGLLSFFVPIPYRHEHGVKIGDTKIGVTTETSKTLPPAVGMILIVGGVGALAAGLRKN